MNPALADIRLPSIAWAPDTLCAWDRRQLYLDGVLTPYFIDIPSRYDRRWNDRKVMLCGAGMGREFRHRDGSMHRMAGELAAFDRIPEAKAKAEQLALDDWMAAR